MQFMVSVQVFQFLQNLTDMLFVRTVGQSGAEVRGVAEKEAAECARLQAHADQSPRAALRREGRLAQ